jgi:hypothetical protein
VSEIAVALTVALEELRSDRRDEAIMILAQLHDDSFAMEIEDLVRSGHVSDAIDRVNTYAHPKFPSAAACALHVVRDGHYDSRSLTV